MLTIRLDYHWTVPDAAQPLDAKLFEVLHGVAQTGSLSQATRQAGVSYRHAWGMLGKWSQLFGQPLVILERGRGATLTAFGEKLLWAEQRAKARLSPQLDSLASELERELNEVLASPQPLLRIHASHDLALLQLRDLAAKSWRLDLQFRGSIDCLASLARSQCDMAGFHIAGNGLGQKLSAPYRRWLKQRSLKLIHFVTRLQGLMVAPGNPKRIRTLADLKRPDVRFVNRQQSSGTRLLFDQLLKDARIDAARVKGYQTEEFTHAAVAATVASGMADAGFGIEAAARQSALDFLPFATEHYFLVCRAGTLKLPAVKALLELLRGQDFRRLVAKLPGYDASMGGQITAVSDALP